MSIIAKYKFDGSVYADLIPEFNAEFTDYTVTDEIDSENSNHIIRTIESDSLPTLMRFGRMYAEGESSADNRTDSLLEVLDMNTSGLAKCSNMFRYCTNLTSISCEWDTSNVNSMAHVFAFCNKLVSLDISNFDTSNVTDMQSMFDGCTNLTSLDVSNFDTSKVTNMYAMFFSCSNLTTLDVSNWNTSNVNNMRSMFNKCNKLTTLDVSNFDTSKVTDMNWMFAYCHSLAIVDVSNFNTSNIANTTSMFYDTFPLTDIGMIYCDQSTINKVASLLPTDHNITIWVESDDILQYDQYDHITYKTQKVQDTVHLNSPLLKGDTIEVIDGKTYHVHRYGKIVFDGSSNEGWYYSYPGDWWVDTKNTAAFHSYVVPPNSGYNLDIVSTHFLMSNYDHIVSVDCEGISRLANIIVIRISKSKLNSLDKQGFEQWLSENPVTVIYQLATPYYELISEEPLELTLLDTTDNTINNNSILPSNMAIANKELSTIAIKPSTTYTLSFDKSNKDSEVTIDICGGEQITTVLNRIELTTPSELGSGIRFISSDGCIISNVRLLEGSLVKEAIPKETFEGLQSSFDEGYIIGENLITTNVSETTGQTLRRDFSKRIYKSATVIISSEYVGKLRMSMCRDNLGWVNNYPITTTIQHFSCNTDEFYNCVSIAKADITLEELANLDIIVLEGDHTHLSEAELMRYIEKGTSHYEEEDYNHVGKYKVEYKVTGKNKLNVNSLTSTSNNFIVLGDKISINTPSQYCLMLSEKLDLIPGNQYVLQGNVTPGGEVSIRNLDGISIAYLGDKADNRQSCKFIATEGCYFRCSNRTLVSTDVNFSNIQLEEGTVATEYEPYKEDIKTYYLSSPLLEGDTIEDINGVATHVKRYEKIVFDGDEYWSENTHWSTDAIKQFYTLRFPRKPQTKVLSDKFTYASNTIQAGYDCIGSSDDTPAIYIAISSLKLSTHDINGFIQWLSENPTTVVYELASPIYEPISDESILCDSYVNGHLDVDTNIPIEKVDFKYTQIPLRYMQGGTNYKIQFNSDNVGKIKTLYNGNSVYNVDVVKGLNKILLLTNANPKEYIVFDGIGFNASNIQVVEVNEDIEFDYFKGLQSSFEDGLVTDENDENYGKYKVECKIVGKNKFNGKYEKGYIDIKRGFVPVSSSEMYTTMWIKCKPNTTYIVKANYESSSYKRNRWLLRNNSGQETIIGGTTGNETPKITTLNDTTEFRVYFKWEGDPTNVKDIAETLQIEEGTQATSYEPYKESIHTLYLNSPLLKGDKLVVHDGKLCHYHKMGMVVFDGSEDINILDNSNTNTSICSFKLDKIAPSYSIAFCDNFVWIYKYSEDCKHFYVASDNVLFTLEKTKLSSLTVDGWRQWFQQNPTTVVYELAEPYYEPIEPQLSQYSFSTVKDGDMEIITVLPIEKVNLTYRTDINGVSSIEEQIASIQEGADISSIIDEEVDE